MNYQNHKNENVEIWERKEGDKTIQYVAERHKDYTISQEIVYYPKKYYPHVDAPIVISCRYHPHFLSAIVMLLAEREQKPKQEPTEQGDK